MKTQLAGLHAEQQACDYLSSQGLKLVQKNFSCRVGEVDLIMQQGEYLVFIEVRMRSSNQFGGGVASITYTKKQRLLKATTYYLMLHALQDKVPVRFDVVSIEGKSGQVTWIQDAFGTDY